jgi:hypothetical protein
MRKLNLHKGRNNSFLNNKKSNLKSSYSDLKNTELNSATSVKKSVNFIIGGGGQDN